MGNWDIKNMEYNKANISKVKKGALIIVKRIKFLRTYLQSITDYEFDKCKNNLKKINDWLEKIPKRRVRFAANVKPYERKLPYLKSEKKMWHSYLNNDPWAQPIDYYISENYSEAYKHNRVHILRLLKIKWEFLSEAEKFPYMLKAESKITRDPDGIGYIKGESSDENKIKFIMSIIQPSINKLRNINYETCNNCNNKTCTTILRGGEFIKYEDDDEELKCDDNKILNLSLQKAKRASQMKAKVLTKCCKCYVDIWTSSWYFKGVIQHQNAVNWYMDKYGYCKIIDDKSNINWKKKL